MTLTYVSTFDSPARSESWARTPLEVADCGLGTRPCNETAVLARALNRRAQRCSSISIRLSASVGGNALVHALTDLVTPPRRASLIVTSRDAPERLVISIRTTAAIFPTASTVVERMRRPSHSAWRSMRSGYQTVVTAAPVAA